VSVDADAREAIRSAALKGNLKFLYVWISVRPISCLWRCWAFYRAARRSIPITSARPMRAAAP